MFVGDRSVFRTEARRHLPRKRKDLPGIPLMNHATWPSIPVLPVTRDKRPYRPVAWIINNR